jgi:AraC family ethanolamine operon transcriptional activator
MSTLTAVVSNRALSRAAGDIGSRSRMLARRAEALLRQHLAEPPTIAALCKALCARERTLHEAFREHLGTTPKAYLKTLRLCAARHDLLEGLPKTRVTDVALDWGFLHFGWFSQDYRRLFGETPRETLQRARKRTGRLSFVAPVNASDEEGVGSGASLGAVGDAMVIASPAKSSTEEGPWREKRP